MKFLKNNLGGIAMCLLELLVGALLLINPAGFTSGIIMGAGLVLILIGIVIYRNAPSLKGFRERYNLNTLAAWLKKKLGVKKSEETEEKEVAGDEQ